MFPEGIWEYVSEVFEESDIYKLPPKEIDYKAELQL